LSVSGARQVVRGLLGFAEWAGLGILMVLFLFLARLFDPLDVR